MQTKFQISAYIGNQFKSIQQYSLLWKNTHNCVDRNKHDVC